MHCGRAHWRSPRNRAFYIGFLLSAHSESLLTQRIKREGMEPGGRKRKEERAVKHWIWRGSQRHGLQKGEKRRGIFQKQSGEDVSAHRSFFPRILLAREPHESTGMFQRSPPSPPPKETKKNKQKKKTNGPTTATVAVF